MALSGCPGCGQMGPFTLRPFTSISTMSPVSSPDFFAWFGLISTALSQQRLVIGFGVSCNHELLARLPSYVMGSRRKMTSINPLLVPALVGGILPPLAERFFTGNAVLAMNPSFNAWRHVLSKSPPFVS